MYSMRVFTLYNVQHVFYRRLYLRLIYLNLSLQVVPMQVVNVAEESESEEEEEERKCFNIYLRLFHPKSTHVYSGV